MKTSKDNRYQNQPFWKRILLCCWLIPVPFLAIYTWCRNFWHYPTLKYYQNAFFRKNSTVKTDFEEDNADFQLIRSWRWAWMLAKSWAHGKMKFYYTFDEVFGEQKS